MRLAKKEMQHLGYSTTRVTPQPGKLAKIGLTFPYALWRAVDANHVNRGPLLPYLSQRAMAFLPWAQRAANPARHCRRKAQ
jgi:hypothetical protein